MSFVGPLKLKLEGGGDFWVQLEFHRPFCLHHNYVDVCCYCTCLVLFFVSWGAATDFILVATRDKRMTYQHESSTWLSCFFPLLVIKGINSLWILLIFSGGLKLNKWRKPPLPLCPLARCASPSSMRRGVEAGPEKRFAMSEQISAT